MICLHVLSTISCDTTNCFIDYEHKYYTTKINKLEFFIESFKTIQYRRGLKFGLEFTSQVPDNGSENACALMYNQCRPAYLIFLGRKCLHFCSCHQVLFDQERFHCWIKVPLNFIQLLYLSQCIVSQNY